MHQAAGPLDQFPPQPIAEARPFARATQDKQSLDAAGKDPLHEPFQHSHVKFVGRAQRRDQRGNDTMQLFGELHRTPALPGKIGALPRNAVSLSRRALG